MRKMRQVLQKISCMIGKSGLYRGKRHKSRGQSLVEVAIAFPILIILFTGVVEFGFILNFYLSLLDATRDSARLYSGGDPFDETLFDPSLKEDTFYNGAAFMVQRTLDPSIDDKNYVGRRILLDSDVDDVIVSVYGAEKTKVTNLRNQGPYHLFPKAGDNNGNYPSIFTEEALENTRTKDAPNAGILVVEVHYNYHHVLNLPWLTVFLPNPLHLQAYTIMPLRSAEP